MGEPAPWTVLRLLNWTRDYLAKAGIESPRLAAEVLLAHALGCKRIELYTRHDYLPSAEQLTTFRDAVQKAREHQPIAYLVGEKEFYSLRFRITPDVLIPRPETEALVAEALAHLKARGGQGRVWDVCTGSGCVAVAIAHEAPQSQVLATDVSPAAVAVAQANAELNKVADRVRVRQADLLALPDDCGEMAPFDVVTANPPYVAQGQEVAPSVRHEPAMALYGGLDGLDFIRRIIADAPARLAGGGLLAMEFGQGQGDDVRDLLVATGQFAEPRIIRDHQHIERIATAVRKG
jgi:release factor glutamine methyltransferase